MPPEAIFDVTQIDFTRIVVDRETIRKVNPQRFEMEQVDAIVYVDPAQHIMIGYKDVTDKEFWVRGHFPHEAIFPGVLMCEAAAQVCAIYYARHGPSLNEFL